jgi:hypothetical protein
LLAVKAISVIQPVARSENTLLITGVERCRLLSFQVCNVIREGNSHVLIPSLVGALLDELNLSPLPAIRNS